MLRFKNSWVERNWQLGPYFASYMDDKFVWHPDWEERHAIATWEINWPTSQHSPWPEELIGIMDFEYDEWKRDILACH